MLFERLYDDALAQASYLIGCAASGTAIIVDPNRRVGQYLAAAEARGLRITAVTETHIHADFVSGSRELAALTGARLYLSDAGPEEWRYAFRDEPNVMTVRGGEVISVGQIELRAVHTPGHTPEHLSFLVTDTAVMPDPMGILTGDFVFVGDVGRPDLLETAAHIAGAAQTGAHQLFRSLAWFKTLPDHLQIWPGHGAGSACGKGLSAVPQSTVGYERRSNWALGIDDEAEFVRQALAGQPEPPGYFAEMKRINKRGPAILGTLPIPERLLEPRLRELLAAGAPIVDTRLAADFAAGHVPGTLSIPFNRSFPTWAGSLLPYDRELFLLVDDAVPGAVGPVRESLSMIGLDRVGGYFTSQVLASWTRGGGRLERTGQVEVGALAAAGEALILDVRGRSEWDVGHIPGATNIPLAELPERLEELPRNRAIAVHCQGGGRSAIAAGLLQAHGFERVQNVPGGFGAWADTGLPVEGNGIPARTL